MTEIDRYEAEAFCPNCQFVGPVRPVLGERIHSEVCPVCRAAQVMSSCDPYALQARGLLSNGESA